ncbi:efflux RND transporter periplasmic adaptor subunit [Azospirillum halopraeferens]|uniref:efflux RND transporter periplasmic adaptor subunit n=1 Tax=Azospirillum halopraeferens TaxID=34010 RepID=UPI001FDEA380|nr:efflux RND transporter periplasmic adaptor subunit [Azospirillum halopraeferens]
MTLSVAVVLGAGGAALWYAATAAPPPSPYRTVRVERGPLVSAIAATGTLEALVTVEVGSQLSGQITALHADYNSRVSGDQVIAELNDAPLRARLDAALADAEAARASLAVQEAQRDKAEADLGTVQAEAAAAATEVTRAELVLLDAERDLKRRRDLRGVVSAADLEKAETAARSARAGVAAAQARLRSAEAAAASTAASLRVAEAQRLVARAQVAQRDAAVRVVQVDIDRSIIRSPIDGVVVARSVSVGQTVAASLQAPTLFTIAGDLRSMQVLASIDESDIGRVRVGQPVSFTVGAYPGERFEGAVREVRLAPREDQNVVTYTVVVTAGNPELRLLPGMTANLNITVDERPDALKLPNAALRFRPPGTAAPGAGSGSADGPVATALAVLVRRVESELKPDDGQRRELAGILAESRDRLAAVAALPGDPEGRRAAARAVRTAAEERIAAMLDEGQRRLFAELLLAPPPAAAVERTVWVPDPAGVAQPVTVRLGIGDGSVTEILEGGLTAGQEVITGLAPAEPPGGRRGGIRLSF